MTNVLKEIVALLVSGVVDFGTGLAGGITNYMEALFIKGSGESMALSTTGGIIIIFAAIALTCGITAKVWHFITSLGASK